METYMSVDEFLEKYYTALNRQDNFSGIFWLVASRAPQDFFAWYNERKGQLKTSEMQELYAEIAKAMQSGTQDAQNFLYTVQVLTSFDNVDYGQKVSTDKLNEYAKVILFAIQNGTIKNPKNSYQVLKHIVGAIGKNNPTLLRQQALHPLSTPKDVRQWLSYFLNGPYYSGTKYEYKKEGLGTPEFVGSVNDAKKKLNDLVAQAKAQINAELNKPMPDMDTIKSFVFDYIPDVAYQIVAIVKYFAERTRPELRDGQTQEDVAKAKAVADELAREFDMDKILDVSNGNYVQQYADQAEFQLAEMRPAFEKMQQELETLRPAYTKQNRQLMEQSSSISNLEDDKTKLLRENQNLLSTLEFLKGELKLFLKMFGERADKRELPIQKAKGLQEIVENNLRKTVDIEQIEKDLKTAKEKQQQIMRNGPVRI